MRVTWTVQVEGIKGNAVLCRNEEEAARLVLQLLLLGVIRNQVIVDGEYLFFKGTKWIWKALNV